MAKYLQGVGASAILFTVAGTDLSDHLKSITIGEDYEDVDTTAMNSVTKTHTPGLRDDQWECEFFQDFAASSVNATIGPLLGSSTGATLVFQTSGTTVSVTNPKYTMVGAPFTWQPVSGTVGEASMVTVTFLPVSGSYTVEATS